MNNDKAIPDDLNKKYDFQIYVTVFIWLVLLLLFWADSSSGTPPDPTAETIVNHLKTDLGLTDDQTGKVLPIIRDSVARGEQLKHKYMNQGSPDLRALNKEAEKIRNETEQRLSPILTAEQMEKFKDLRDEQQKKTRAKFLETIN